MKTSHLREFIFFILYFASVVLAAVGNTTCLSGQLDWYTSAVGETPCMTYQRLRQICNSDYAVGNFAATTPGDHCDDQVSDCCCNSVAFALSMLCMNCQEDATSGNVAGIDAAPGTYTTYLSSCSPITNQSLPQNIQQAVCNLNIKLDNFLYNRSYWTDGSWFYRWTADYAVEQQAEYNNNTFTVCPNQVSPSASLPASTTMMGLTSTTNTAAMSTSSGNTASPTSSTSTSSTSTSSTSTSSSKQAEVIGGAVGGSALAIIAVLAGFFCIRRRRRPLIIQDMPSLPLNRPFGGQPVYGTSFTDTTQPETTQGSSVLSPVRLTDRSMESTLPLMTSLSPVRTQSLNTFSGAASYSLNDSVLDAVPVREDDAGTLIPPDDAPRERLPPAYHPSWVSRNMPQPTLSVSNDQSLSEHDIPVVLRDDTRPTSLSTVRREKGVSRWSSGS